MRAIVEPWRHRGAQGSGFDKQDALLPALGLGQLAGHLKEVGEGVRDWLLGNGVSAGDALDVMGAFRTDSLLLKVCAAAPSVCMLQLSLSAVCPSWS